MKEQTKTKAVETLNKILEMEQTVRLGDGLEYRTTRCPIRMDGERPRSEIGSPKLGEHTEAIVKEFDL